MDKKLYYKAIDKIMRNPSELTTLDKTNLIALYTLTILHAFFNAFFFVTFTIQKTPELANLNAVTFIICLINLFLLTDLRKLALGLFLEVVNICLYVVVATYYLGYNKNAIILLPILVLLIYIIFPLKKKYFLVNTIVILLTYALVFYIRYNIVSKYIDSRYYVELINNFVALFLVAIIVYLKTSTDKLLHSYKDQTISGLVEEASIDFLTGLWNRRHLEKKFETEDFTDAYIILADIDFFKRVNDQYGHICGDYVLKELANILKSSFRNVDYVCRWGGEEFLIYIKHANRMNVIDKLEEIRITIQETTFEYENIKFNITTSFGFCKIDEKLTIDENINRADTALYYGKNNGRNCVHGYLEIKDKL